MYFKSQLYTITIMKRILITIIILHSSLFTLHATAQVALTEFVNPFIGTGGHGHTYPGAVLPFGMVQLSPDTRLNGCHIGWAVRVDALPPPQLRLLA